MTTATPDHPGSTMIALRLPSEFAERVRLAAEADERSVSNFTRRALRAQMAQLEPAQQ
jgi:hypothetical protein